MEKEYIERGALLEELQEEIDFESTMYTEEQNKWLRAGLSIAARDVRNQPTADVVPRDEVERYKGLCEDLQEENLDLLNVLHNESEYVAKKIFEEIESVLFTVARPCPSADGTIKVKHSKDFHIRREDYYTIKEKYTKGGEGE